MGLAPTLRQRDSGRLIDATIVRAVLLPATMKLLGEWNWYLPRGLSWLARAAGQTVRPATPASASSRA
jgi:uncharacterized membrane protein YdfJ with MMPL/SSD domain